MEQRNAKNWSSQPSEESENSESTFRVGGVGTISDSSVEHGAYEVRACREDCNESNNFISGQQLSDGIDGKLVRQLVNETEKQLAYHKQQAEYHEQQAEVLKQRLEELNQIPESFNTDHTE